METIGGVFDSLIAKMPGFAEQLAQARQERERDRKRLNAKYGVEFNDWQIADLVQAEKQLKICAQCEGAFGLSGKNLKECPKDNGDTYWQPVISAKGEITYKTCALGEQRMLMNKFRALHMPNMYLNKTLSDYDVTRDNDDAVAMAKWFITKYPPTSLYYHGAPGTGKTFLACIIAKEWLRAKKTVIFGEVPSLMEEIKLTFDRDDISAQDVLDKYGACDLLILDDIGAGKVSDWGVEMLYRIINERYGAEKSCVITSNYSLSALEKKLGLKDSMAAARIISRLRAMCAEADLGKVDRRARR